MENYENPKRKYNNKISNIEYEKDQDKNENKDKKEKKIEEINIDLKKAAKHTKLILEGIEVYFPYVPYECQTLYMTKVIQALNGGQLAALESPTGTGKTLCLLCASLAWLKSKRLEIKRTSGNNGADIKIPFIYYTSRTHSQITNVIKELKKTCYKPRTAILSSRENLCINSLVKNSAGTNINLKCKIARAKKECKYYQNSESIKTTGFDCIDIEEMKIISEQSSFCPFYFQRKKKDYSDIIFLPYNYIFDKKLIEILKIDLNGSILLIDEAHNIEKVCEDSHSSELSTKTIDSCIEDLKSLSILVEKNNNSIIEFPQLAKNKQDTKGDFIRKIDHKKLTENEIILISLKTYLKSLDVKQGSWPNIGKRFLTKDLFDMIFEGSKKTDPNQTLISGFVPKATSTSGNRKGFNPENLIEHIEFLKLIDEGITQEFNKNSNLSSYIDFLTLIKKLYFDYITLSKKQSETYKVDNDYDCLINNYKIFVLDEDENTNNSNFNSNTQINQKNRESSSSKLIRKISLFCLNPGLGFKHILDSGVISTILTSGTLAPLNSMEAELKCEFKIKLENKHVIDPKQVNFSILTNSFDNSKTVFDFRSNNRGTDMNEKLGYAICDLIKVTPPGTGVLCFFTSYAFMNTCIENWGKKSIISEMEKWKEIFKDSQNVKHKNGNVIKSFNDACYDGVKNIKCKGGLLFSVFRGISSEGIDFSDDKARMVIVVGIPYPNLGDMKVNLKKEFLDEFARKPHKMPSLKLKANEWYLQSALKAVNQAIGRVIRHTYDFGSMILIDTRYTDLVNQNSFSKWLRENHKIFRDKQILERNKDFFDEMKTFIKQKKSYDKSERCKKLEENNSNCSSDNDLDFNNKLKNITKKLSHNLDDDHFENNANKISKKKDFNTCEKYTNNIKNSNNLFSGPFNTIQKTNNKSNFDNKSGNMSFMKTIDELEESLNKNSMKNLLINTNKDEFINKNENFEDTIKKNLNNIEFCKTNFIERNVIEKTNIMDVEENLKNDKKVLDDIKRNLDTNDFINNFDTVDKNGEKMKINNDYLNINKNYLILKESNLDNESIPNQNKNNSNTHINGHFDKKDLICSNVGLEKIDENKNINNFKKSTHEYDDFDWNDLDISDIIKDYKESFSNNFISTNNNLNEQNPLSDLNILNNKNNLSKLDSKNGITVINNLTIINNNSIFSNNLNHDKFMDKKQNNDSSSINNVINDEGLNKKEDKALAPMNNKNIKSNTGEVIKNGVKKNEAESEIDEIDTDKIFTDLRKLKEKTNLEALFERYNIEINIKKDKKEENKIECPVCFENQEK